MKVLTIIKNIDDGRGEMKYVPTNEKVKIKLFVYAGDEKIPHTSHMAGEWGWDFECSCGYKSSTGGAVRNYVFELIKEHKMYVHNYEMTSKFLQQIEAK
jgi:hypothetical protein